jgi:hypothetical protein
MNKLRILFTGISILSVSISFSQTEKSVSENASFTICFNGKNIQNQMSIAEFEKLEIIDELKQEIGHYDDPKIVSLKKMGFDYSKNAYFSIERLDTATAVIFTMPLASNKWIISELAKDEGNVKSKKGKYTIFRDYRNAFIISKNQLLFVDYDVDYRYEDYSVVEAVEKAVEQTAEEAAEVYKKPVYKNEKGEEISKWEWKNIQKFKYALAYGLDRMAGKNAAKDLNRPTKAPVYAWADGNFINKLNPRRGFRNFGDIKAAQEELFNKFGGAKMFAELNIDEKGGILSFESTFNEQMTEMYNKVYSTKLNENLLKFIPEDAIGYSSYAINAKEVYNQYKNMFKDFSSTNKDILLAKDIWDLVDLALDEDAIFETIKGEAIVSFNGIEEVEFTKTKWEYDEETFEEKRVEVTAKENFPVFTGVFAIGNKEMYEKVFRIISRNERDFEQRKDGSWIAKDRKLQTYFYLTEEALIVTNGTNFNQQTAKHGYTKSLYSKREEISQSPVNFYFDFTRFMESIPQSEIRERDRAMFEAAKKYQGTIKLLPSKLEGNKWTSNIRINTAGPKGENGLQHFMNFFNDIYVVEQKRREERRMKREKSDTVRPAEGVIEDAKEATESPED